MQKSLQLLQQQQSINQIMLSHSLDKLNHKTKNTYKSIVKSKPINQPKTQPQIKKQKHQLTSTIKSYTKHQTQRQSQHQHQHNLSKQKLQSQKQKHQTKHNNNTKNIQQKLTQSTQPHYDNFIQKNITKLVKTLNQEKQALEPTNTNTTNIIPKKNNQNIIKSTTPATIKYDKKKPLIFQKKHQPKNQNKSNQTTTNFKQSLLFVDQIKSRANSKQQITHILSSSALFQNSKAMLLRKEEKIQKYRQQKIQKQIQQTTFQPQSFTSNYRSKNQFIDNKNKNLRNFIKRQQADNQMRRKNHFKQLKEAMQECSFQPRLNVNSKHSSSIVKEIWRPNSSLQRNYTNNHDNNKITIQHYNKSIEKFQKHHQFTPHNLSVQQQARKSIDGSLYNSKRSTLFNQSTEISIHDSKELSFLLK